MVGVTSQAEQTVRRRAKEEDRRCKNRSGVSDNVRSTHTTSILVFRNAYFPSCTARISDKSPDRRINDLEAAFDEALTTQSLSTRRAGHRLRHASAQPRVAPKIRCATAILRIDHHRRAVRLIRGERGMTINNPTILSADAAAEFLRLATSTLAKLRLSGNGPVYCKLGRRVVYRKEDLEAWLASRVARNTSDADARLPKSLTEKANGRLKANPDTAPTRLNQASAAPTRNSDARLSKAGIGKRSRSQASGTRKC